MKAGTIIQMADGRIGTVVYNGLDGVGVKWGEHEVTLDDLSGGNPMKSIGIGSPDPPFDYKWLPEAMLRKNYANATIPCVGKDFEVLARQQEGEPLEQIARADDVQMLLRKINMLETEIETLESEGVVVATQEVVRAWKKWFSEMPDDFLIDGPFAIAIARLSRIQDDE